MVSPRPIVRPVMGDWAVDGLLDDLPTRPQHATEQLRKIVDFYLHSMVFDKDRLGRPVRCASDRLVGPNSPAVTRLRSCASNAGAKQSPI